MARNGEWEQLERLIRAGLRGSGAAVGDCLGDEELAAGLADPAGLQHLEGCDDCADALMLASDALDRMSACRYRVVVTERIVRIVGPELDTYLRFAAMASGVPELAAAEPKVAYGKAAKEPEVRLRFGDAIVVTRFKQVQTGWIGTAVIKRSPWRRTLIHWTREEGSVLGRAIRSVGEGLEVSAPHDVPTFLTVLGVP
jgi:hypothetical protein